MNGIAHQKTCKESERCRCDQLVAKNVPNLNAEIAFRNVFSGETMLARVTRMKRSNDGKLEGIGIEMLVLTETGAHRPDPAFRSWSSLRVRFLPSPFGAWLANDRVWCASFPDNLERGGNHVASKVPARRP